MKPAEALEYFGSKAELARVCGVAPPSVIEWFDNDEIPEGRQYQIELATGGKLKADRPANRKADQLVSGGTAAPVSSSGA